MNVTTARVDSTEATALAVVGVGTLLLGSYGFVTHSPNTVPYVSTVCAVTAMLLRFRRTSMPARVTLALALLGVAHLAGGLVTVGDDVLYNAHLGVNAIEYDHFVHAAGVLLGTVVLWTNFVARAADDRREGQLILVCVLAGLGLGAVNETIEFLLTVTHGGTHVGGYTNTGWDLVSNVVGAVTAGVYLRRT